MSARILRQLALTGIIMTGIASVTPAYAAADSWITTKVKLQLLTSDNVSGSDINVDTNDGVVVLHGKVNTDMEKQKAESVARATDGVKSVKNLLQVVPSSKEKSVNDTDDHIKTIVERNLKQEKDLGDIRVASINNGIVLLSGEVDSIDQELRAVRAAAKAPGVKRVATEITTEDEKHASNDAMRDEKMGDEKGSTTQQRTASSAEHDEHDVRDDAKGAARGTGHKITAATNDATDAMKGGATTAAESTRHAGNKVVGAGSDGSVTSAVKLRFMGDSRVPALDVNVDTNHGVVTLFGIVPSQQAKQAAEADARKVAGVTKVKNEIQVVPSSERKVTAAKDDDIEKSVEGAFKNMKDFEKVDVAAKNGVVRLTGEVATLEGKVRAATIARSQTGVRAVEDDLKVER